MGSRIQLEAPSRGADSEHLHIMVSHNLSKFENDFIITGIPEVYKLYGFVCNILSSKRVCVDTERLAGWGLQ